MPRLALTLGEGMKKTTLIIVATPLVLIATVFKGILNEFTTSKPSPDAVSYSIIQAKRENVLFYELDVHPDSIETEAGPRRIESAWIEKNSDHAFRLVWFHYRKEKDGYKIILKPESGDLIWSSLVIPGKGRSFTNIGGGHLFYETIDAVPEWPLNIELRESWKEPPIQILTLNPKT